MTTIRIDKINFKRGLLANLPSSAELGEPLFVTDEECECLYIGKGVGKPLIKFCKAGTETIPQFSSYEGKKYILHNPYEDGGSLHLKGQMHCHTYLSDGNDSPTALVTAYKNAGYDFITITDHDYITDNPNVSGITWLGKSVEESKDRHVCAYDVTNRTSASSINAQDAINFHNSKGRMTNLAHPSGILLGGYSKIEKPECLGYYDFSFTEIYNTLFDYSEGQWDWILTNGKRVFGLCVDDCHNVNGSAFNKGWIVVHTDENSATAIKESLRKGNFYASKGNDIAITLEGNVITATSSESSTFTFFGKNKTTLKTEYGVTTSSYTIKGDEVYVRVQASKSSNSDLAAWSQPIFIETFAEDKQQISEVSLKSDLVDMKRQGLMNSNFDVWQRGTSLSNPSDGVETLLADRWVIYDSSNAGTLPSRTHSRQPAYGEFSSPTRYYYKMSFSGAETINADGIGCISQKIINGTSLLGGVIGKKITVSFWAKSNISNKKIGIFLEQNYGTGGTPYASEIVNGAYFTLTSNWKKYTYTFSINPLYYITTNKVIKTFGTNGDDFLKLTIAYAWGVNNAVKVGDTIAQNFGTGYVNITQTHLYASEVEMAYPVKSFNDELNDCLAFYEKSYNYEVAPNTVSTLGQLSKITFDTSKFFDGNVKFNVRKVNTPTVIIYSTATLTADNVGQTGFTVGGSGLTANQEYLFHYVADSGM